MFKKLLIIITIFLISYSTQSFTAQKKEEAQSSQVEKKETSEKERARLFYVEHIVNNKFSIEDEAQILQFIYYWLKMENASIFEAQLRGINEKLKNITDTWKNIRTKNMEYSERAFDDIVFKYEDIWGHERILQYWQQLLSALYSRRIEIESEFHKELYTLLYRDIKLENPELLIIKSGDDDSKELPKPEDLDLPLFYWKKHGFEDYKPSEKK